MASLPPILAPALGPVDSPQAAPPALMTLGLFVFALPTLLFEELTRTRNARHATIDRFGARAASQFVGEGEETVTLTGMLVPEIAGRFASLDTLDAMRQGGNAHQLIDGTGVVWGSYVIVRLDERRAVFTENGRPRKTDFALDLLRVG